MIERPDLAEDRELFRYENRKTLGGASF